MTQSYRDFIGITPISQPVAKFMASRVENDDMEGIYLYLTYEEIYKKKKRRELLLKAVLVITAIAVPVGISLLAGML